MFVTIAAKNRVETPPEWATLQRQLIEKMNRAAPQVLKKYTRSDGTLMWPSNPDFTSIDGLDDAYESFHNWPLFYMLGGDAQFLTDAHAQFDRITRDMARYNTGHGYPMVVKEYQPGYDWFHQGEGNYLFYMLCMADPSNRNSIERAETVCGIFHGRGPGCPKLRPTVQNHQVREEREQGAGILDFYRCPLRPLGWVQHAVLRRAGLYQSRSGQRE